MTRPTPETDALAYMDGPIAGSGVEVVNTDLARRLERQRDEAVELLRHIAEHLEKSPKFAAVEYSDELLVPYQDIAKAARVFLERMKEGK